MVKQSNAHTEDYSIKYLNYNQQQWKNYFETIWNLMKKKTTFRFERDGLELMYNRLLLQKKIFQLFTVTSHALPFLKIKINKCHTCIYI